MVIRWFHYIANFKYFLNLIILFLIICTIVMLISKESKSMKSKLVQVNGIFLRRNQREFIRCVLIITRMILILSGVIWTNQSLPVFAVSLVLSTLVIDVLMFRRISYILLDGVFCVLLFNAIMIKDFLLNYLNNVIFDRYIHILVIMLMICIVLFAGCSFSLSLTNDLNECAYGKKRRGIKDE